MCTSAQLHRVNCVFIRLFCVRRHLRAPGLHILWRLALPVVRCIASTKLRLLLILSSDTDLSNAPWSASPCAVWGFCAASFFWGPKDSFVSAFTAGLLWAVGLFSGCGYWIIQLTLFLRWLCLPESFNITSKEWLRSHAIYFYITLTFGFTLPFLPFYSVYLLSILLSF